MTAGVADAAALDSSVASVCIHDESLDREGRQRDNRAEFPRGARR